MPPARKSPERVHPMPGIWHGVGKPTSKMPIHFVNLTQFRNNDKPVDNNCHLKLNLSQAPPTMVMLQRSGNQLVVETKTEGSGKTTKSYNYPEGDLQKLGAQFTPDNILSIGGPGVNAPKARVIRIDLNYMLGKANKMAIDADQKTPEANEDEPMEHVDLHLKVLGGQ